MKTFKIEIPKENRGKRSLVLAISDEGELLSQQYDEAPISTNTIVWEAEKTERL